MRPRLRSLLLPSTAAIWLGLAFCAFGQDGASFDTRAKQPPIPPLSLANAADTPERMAALSELLQGKTEQGLADLKSLAEHGDAPSALLLAGAYRRKTVCPSPPIPRLRCSSTV